MYTTNDVASLNSSFRKVTKKGVIPNENAPPQINLYQNYRTLQKMEQQQSSKLGYGQESARDRRQNQNPYQEIQAFNLTANFINEWYPLFDITANLIHYFLTYTLLLTKTKNIRGALRQTSDVLGIKDPEAL